MKFVILVTFTTPQGRNDLTVTVNTEPKDACKAAREMGMAWWKEMHGKETCVVDTPIIAPAFRKVRST